MFISKENNYTVPVTYVSSENLGLISTEFANDMAKQAVDMVKSGARAKVNAIWLEASGCFGQIISLLNAENPDVPYMLREFLDIKYFGSIQGDEGESAYEHILNTINTEYVFIVSGAVPVAANGLYTTVATYKGRKITAMEAVSTIAKNAKYIVSVGTCASYGGPTAAKPNLSEAKSVSEFLGRNDVIKIPGCPANPVWIMGILGYLVNYGMPALDRDGRPIAYYGELIHDRCPRRGYFDEGIFAKTFGEKECMFLLGCKGPTTYAYCPVSRWNSSENWPIGDNTACIGCATPGFPDNMQPFMREDGAGDA